MILLFAVLVFLELPTHAQEGELDKSPPKGVTPEQVIQRFSAKEKEWKKAREQYTFRQTIRAQALDGESEIGEYRQVADISYQNGKRVKQVVFSPQASTPMICVRSASHFWRMSFMRRGSRHFASGSRLARTKRARSESMRVTMRFLGLSISKR